jgi:uncharacterized membrane protein (DUF485 family)
MNLYIHAHHNIAEIQLRLALNTNQAINVCTCIKKKKSSRVMNVLNHFPLQQYFCFAVLVSFITQYLSCNVRNTSFLGWKLIYTTLGLVVIA